MTTRRHLLIGGGLLLLTGCSEMDFARALQAEPLFHWVPSGLKQVRTVTSRAGAGRPATVERWFYGSGAAAVAAGREAREIAEVTGWTTVGTQLPTRGRMTFGMFNSGPPATEDWQGQDLVMRFEWR